MKVNSSQPLIRCGIKLLNAYCQKREKGTSGGDGSVRRIWEKKSSLPRKHMAKDNERPYQLFLVRGRKKSGGTVGKRFFFRSSGSRKETQRAFAL